MSDPKLNLLLTADDKTAAAFNALNNRLQNVERSAKRTSDSFSSFGKNAARIFAGFQVFELVKKTIDLADAYKSVNARLNVVTDSTKEFKSAQSGLFDISQKTRTGLQETTELYAQLARGTKDMKLPQETMLKLTEGINKAVTLSGSSTQAANAALVQLSQGFAAGALRGQEFMSVQEQAPVILETVRKGLGKTQGELKKMAEEGQLTNDVFIKGFFAGMDGLNDQFSQLPVTVSQSMTRIGNSLMKAVGEIDSMLGATSKLADVISSLSEKVTALSQEFVTGTELAGGFWEAMWRFGTQNPFNTAAEQADKYQQSIVSLLAEQKKYGQYTTSYARIQKQIDSERINLAFALSRLEKDKTKSASMRARAAVIKPVEIKGQVKVDEKAENARKKFLDQLQAQYDKLIYSDRELVQMEAQRLGVNVEQALSLFDQAQAMRDLDAASKAASDEAQQRLKDIFDAGKEQDANNKRQKNVIAGFQNQMQAYKDMLAVRNSGLLLSQEEIDYQERMNQLNKAYNASKLQIEKAGGIYTLQNLEALGLEYEMMKKIIAQIKEKAIAQKNDLFGGFQSGMKIYFDDVSNFSKMTEDATIRAFKGMEDALVSFVQTGKLNFGDLARSIIADIARIYVRQSMITPLLSAIGLGGSSVPLSTPGVTYSPEAWAASSAAFSLSGKKASGGPVTGGKTYLVGEKGPELFTASSSGNITPNNQLGGGGVTVVQNINLSTGVQQTVRAEVISMMPMIANAAKSAVADAKLRGGSYGASLA